jgi:nicotinamidase-related amidase
MDSFEFLVSWWFLLGSFLVVYVALYFLYIRKPIDEVGWKKADYWWLLIAAFGLFPAVYNLRADVEQDQSSILKSNEKNAASTFATKLALLSDSDICVIKRPLIHTRVDVTKPDIQRTCHYFRTSLIERSDGRQDFPSFEKLQEDTAAFATVSDTVFLDRLDDVSKSARIYWDNVNEYDNYTNPNNRLLYKTYLALAPLSLILALAIRLAKVTGEIRLKRPDAFKLFRRKKTLVLRLNEAVADPIRLISETGEEAVAANINELFAVAKNQKLPAVQVFHWPENRPESVYLAADRTAIAGVETIECDVRKLLFNSKLHHLLKGQRVNRVVICGALAQSSIEILARMLVQLDYKVVIALDACFDLTVLQGSNRDYIDETIAPHAIAQWKAFDVAVENTAAICKQLTDK